MEINYDEDISGRYRSRQRNLDLEASHVLDTSRTSVNLQMELREAREIDEEELSRSMRSMVRV